MRGRDDPTEHTKIRNHKNCEQIKFVRIWIQSLIFVTNEQIKNPLIRSLSWEVDFQLERLDL